jgi:hypothetical protein
MDYQADLRNLKQDHEFFIGIDSDGCVFDSMEVKQKKFFIPNALKYFDLYSVSGILTETCQSLFDLQGRQQVYLNNKSL